MNTILEAAMVAKVEYDAHTAAVEADDATRFSQAAKRYLTEWLQDKGLVMPIEEESYPLTDTLSLTAGKDEGQWGVYVSGSCPQCGKWGRKWVGRLSAIAEQVENFQPEYHTCPIPSKSDPLDELKYAIGTAWKYDEAGIRTDHLLALTAEVLIEIARRLP